LVRIEAIIVGLILIHFVIGISAKKIIINILPPMIASIAMGVFGYFLKQLNSSISWDIFSIILCALFYFLILSLFPKMRKTLVKGFAALKKIKA
jgi:PST family polysaccharide transporter